jgi:hypothetical protein
MQQTFKYDSLMGTKVKVKLSLYFIKHYAIKMYGVVEVWLPIFLTLARDGSEWSASHPHPLYTQKRACGTQCRGDWVSTTISLGTKDITILHHTSSV